MKNWIAVIAGTLLCGQAAIANDKPTRLETRTRIAKEVVLFVGDCRLQTQTTKDLDGNTVLTTNYDLSYHVCQEHIDYQVEVAGRGWNAKETTVEGSDRAPRYVQKTLEKKFAGSSSKSSDSAADVVDDISRNMNAANLCGQQKSVLMQQSQLDRQSKTFENCSAK